jgi:hypothetical protein
MTDIIVHLDNGDAITLTKDTGHEALLNHYKNRLITKLIIALDDINETIYETYSLDEDTLSVFDNLLYYDTIEEVAVSLNDTHDLNCFDYYPFDEDFFKLFYKNKPYEAARDTHFGKVYWEDKYVTFDAYHWLKTANKIPYDNEAQEILQYWIEEKLERR